MNDIDKIWADAQGRMGWPTYQYLLNAGISKGRLASLYADGFIGTDQITIKGGRWRRMFRGDEAILLPVHAPSGLLADVVAFRLETPKSYWPMVGGQPMLGAENIERAAFDRAPLMVHECPLDWLRADCDGIVVLDWKAYWPLWFDGVPALQIRDRTFAARAAAAFGRPLEPPPIMVPT
jgi:hypothetical protein